MANDRLKTLLKVAGGLALAAPALTACDGICGPCGACSAYNCGADKSDIDTMEADSMEEKGAMDDTMEDKDTMADGAG